MTSLQDVSKVFGPKKPSPDGLDRARLERVLIRLKHDRAIKLLHELGYPDIAALLEVRCEAGSLPQGFSLD